MLYVLVLWKQPSFKQTSETVSAKCQIRRSSLSEFQAVGPTTANARRPHKLRLCQDTTRYNDEHVVDWPHLRLECSSPSSSPLRRGEKGWNTGIVGTEEVASFYRSTVYRPTYSSGVWCGRVSYTLLCVVAIETVTSASFYDVYIKTSRPIGPKLITKKVNNKKS